MHRNDLVIMDCRLLFNQIAGCVLLFLLLAINPLHCADADSTLLFADEPLKSPKGAMIRSMIIPGWGQYYTKNYIKGSLFFAVNGAFFARMLHYNNLYNQAESRRLDLLSANEPDNLAIEIAGVEKRDARDKRGQSAWFLGLSYAVCLIDAYVDANLYKFDDIMDLGVMPVSTDGGVLAIRIRF